VTPVALEDAKRVCGASKMMTNDEIEMLIAAVEFRILRVADGINGAGADQRKDWSEYIRSFPNASGPDST